MIDVGDKPESLRTAVAQALLSFDNKIMSIIKDGNSPKGNIFEIAKVSGTLGAKKTSDLIPYCHPIPIDDVKVDVTIETGYVRILVKVKSIWKTGVEMEALTGATIAALSVYDILKPLDVSISIDNIKLLEKHGGIGDFKEKQDKKLEAVVITISDSRKKDQDESGKLIINALTKNGFNIAAYKIIPDDIKIIEKELIHSSDDLKVNIVITTGGTGVGPRDVTPEATKRILEKEVSGITENLRNYGQSRTPLSMLSRGVSGIRGNTLIVNMPGSTNAVSQSINALFPGVMHIFRMIAGQGHHK
ncbi:cyclic pyranopterin monophosphate synthase [Candidatus Nitrosocosmicus arcticus]|uniref:Cyclic pyranopterin monophosphate synthase n=2 Tax=Candidatus Nitrosocosmicus arcticus TaxID=2035267 RepID=A0A557SXF2_9ARCH|nr:cyclic pyranopterin monophosphate synthase [Candidatus Nitrosocosmicus arcticus]